MRAVLTRMRRIWASLASSFGKLSANIRGAWSYPAAFVGKIVVFAFFYWGVFSAAPDSFRFGEGYNVTPLSQFWSDFYETDDLSSLAANGVDADVESVREQAQVAEAAYTVWQVAEQRRLAKNLEYLDFLDELNEQQERAFEEFQKTEVEPLERRIAETERAIVTADPKDPDLLMIHRALLRLNRELLDKLEGYSSDGFSLLDTGMVERERQLSAELADLSKRELELGKGFREERGKVATIYSDAREEILSKIGLVDFLYFSACISTTTTFGDITANLQWLRLVVAFQIILGIFILARMLEAFARSE